MSRPMIAVCLCACFFVFAACGSDSGQKSATESAALPVIVAKAEKKNVDLSNEWVGQTSAQNSVEIRARVKGYLKEIAFKEGSQVEEGQLLFVIDPKDLTQSVREAEAVLEKNQAALVLAQKDEKRFRALLDQDAVSQDEYDSKLADMKQLKAAVDQSKATLADQKLQLGYTQISSPLAGRIGKAQVKVGSLVGDGENTLLATVASIDPMYVNFSISEADYVRYTRRNEQRKDEDKPEIQLVLVDGEVYEHPGAFDMASPEIDSQTGTLGLRVAFPNPKGLLLPGQFAKIRVNSHSSEPMLVVPQEAIMTVQGTKSVYVVNADNVVEQKAVEIGTRTSSVAQITKGLEEGQTVVVQGQQKIRPGAKVTPLTAEQYKQLQQKQAGGQEQQDKQ
ncbi:efflux RND transporter periplasmic adaptor subunit [Salidesulfovibrio onnuriiensis]|uniref:efflux RND transporter periplasmic adaptor subunit n=1 Tax=Salidesulfovibrio onnuriiensis TaxID=2583823 RepID=UPI0016501675|nr:efflux RND transporter periplasmic adaptor subunit [Salidesulfovibrio onnuriiensis]